MNERIKELAVQARNYALDKNRIYERIHNTEQCMEEYREVYNKKFAELIAQECARLAMTQHCSTSPADYGDMEPYEQGCDDTASRISGLIRRTFGVKE